VPKYLSSLRQLFFFSLNFSVFSFESFFRNPLTMANVPTFTAGEVAVHKTAQDLWIIVHGKGKVESFP
jgi:hypothetical protein